LKKKRSRRPTRTNRATCLCNAAKALETTNTPNDDHRPPTLIEQTKQARPTVAWQHQRQDCPHTPSCHTPRRTATVAHRERERNGGLKLSLRAPDDRAEAAEVAREWVVLREVRLLQYSLTARPLQHSTRARRLRLSWCALANALRGTLRYSS
jgi:hypothetical protein